MLVYGDRSRHVDPREALEALAGEAAALRQAPAGLVRHARIAGALIAAGELAQGLADDAFHRRGEIDARSPVADLSQALTGEFATQLAASWRSGFTNDASSPDHAIRRLAEVLPSQRIEVRACEGYAFYAVYPELYAQAAATMRPAPRIVGLRSIGTSLAAAAAAGCGAAPPLTLRPCGDPFAREVRLSPALATELSAPSAGGWAVVDEGPGLSGSSFAAVGDMLEAQGAPAASVTYLPSHAGSPGPQAPAARRERWAGARRRRADFDDVVRPRLIGWVEPLAGPALAPLDDLSGGLWRDHVPATLRDAPAWPEQERRKFRLRTDAGVFLLKFAGLGAVGEAKLARARALYEAGFAAESMGLAHGFLVERWIDGAPLDHGRIEDRGDLLDHLVRYLAFRARALSPPQPGACAERMREMMVRNLALAGLQPVAQRAADLVSPRSGPPIAIDGRLHAWEWRTDARGRRLKTDALDHAEAHDLIGAQDLSWDVAGATIEFTLSSEEGGRLRASLEGEARVSLDPRRVAFQTLAYLAFQIGWWRMAADGCDGARAALQVARYVDLARRWRPAA